MDDTVVHLNDNDHQVVDDTDQIAFTIEEETPAGLVAAVATWAVAYAEADQLPDASELDLVIGELAGFALDGSIREQIGKTIRKILGKDMPSARTISSDIRARAEQLAAEPAGDEVPEGFVEADPDDPLLPDHHYFLDADEAERAELADELWQGGASEIAAEADIMAAAIEDIRAVGIVGEDHLLRLTLLSAVSRLQSNPISLNVKGESSSGKSHVTGTILSTLPSKAVLHITTASSLALVYTPRDLRHIVISVGEATAVLKGGENDTFSYLLRVIVSEKRLEHTVTVDDPGTENGKTAVTIVKEGPIGLIITTTANFLHSENETRAISFNTTETKEHTRAVIGTVARRATGDIAGKVNRRRQWRHYHAWLGLGARDVVVPFARELGDKFPIDQIRFRRSIQHLISLISAHALLNRPNRDVDDKGRIVATLDDYAGVRDIYEAVISTDAGNVLPDRIRTLVQSVQDLISTPVKTKDGKVLKKSSTAAHVKLGIRELAKMLGVAKATAHRRVQEAIDLGLLVNAEMRPKAPMVLSLTKHAEEALEGKSVLPEVVALNSNSPGQP